MGILKNSNHAKQTWCNARNVCGSIHRQHWALPFLPSPLCFLAWISVCFSPSLSLCQFRTPFFLLARLCFLELMKKVKGEIEEDWEGRCWDGYDVCVQQYLCFLRKEKPIYFGYNGGTVKRRWVWNKETVSCCCWWIAKSKERVYSFGLFCGCWLKGGSGKWEWVLKGQCERERESIGKRGA